MSTMTLVEECLASAAMGSIRQFLGNMLTYAADDAYPHRRATLDDVPILPMRRRDDVIHLLRHPLASTQHHVISLCRFLMAPRHLFSYHIDCASRCHHSAKHSARIVPPSTMAHAYAERVSWHFLSYFSIPHTRRCQLTKVCHDT